MAKYKTLAMAPHWRRLYPAFLCICPILFGQPRPGVERGNKACWFINLPAWRQPAGWEKPESGLMELEFRENSSVEGVILLGLRILPRNGLKNRSTSVYSENRYWISMKSKQRPRLATDEEWNAASEIVPLSRRCLECKHAENHAVLLGNRTYIPSHSYQHT